MSWRRDICIDMKEYRCKHCNQRMPGLPIYDEEGKVIKWSFVWDPYNWEPVEDERGHVFMHRRIADMPPYPFDKLYRVLNLAQHWKHRAIQFGTQWYRSKVRNRSCSVPYAPGRAG